MKLVVSLKDGSSLAVPWPASVGANPEGVAMDIMLDMNNNKGGWVAIKEHVVAIDQIVMLHAADDGKGFS